MEWLIIQINNQAPQRFIQVFVHRKYYRVARNSIGFNYVLLFYNVHCTVCYVMVIQCITNILFF